MQHPLCEDCLEEDKVTQAVEVHHIRPILTGKDELEMAELAYNPSNLRSLCKECHNNIHKKLRKRDTV